MTVKSPHPATLLLHDGELADVRALLEELGAPFEERPGRPSPTDRPSDFELVIATPKRILDLSGHVTGHRPTRIAILAGEARTLRKLMQREKVEFVVRRPVHPVALRLLIGHALYRGPEKRLLSRVPVGAPVRVRTRWLWRPAVLLDLSVRGCRLESHHPVERGDRVSIRLPAKVTGRRALSLRGRVVRRRPADQTQPGVDVVAVHFDASAFELVQQLQATVAGYASGPAALHRAAAKRLAAATPPPGAEPAATPARGAGASSRERGVRGDRRRFARRVIALGDEFSRVLIGRDLSVGGMRVDPNPDLAPGDWLQIALHVHAGELPLVVRAEVCRDDGEQGLALQFRELSGEARSYLREMVGSLPVIEAPSAERPEGDAVGVVVSEILEARGA